MNPKTRSITRLRIDLESSFLGSVFFLISDSSFGDFIASIGTIFIVLTYFEFSNFITQITDPKKHQSITKRAKPVCA